MILSLIAHSWRAWKRERGVALLAIFALVVGIGGTTAIFSVVEAVLLRPLPYSQGDRWVALFAGDKTDTQHFSGLSYGDALAYQEGTHSFATFGWFPVAGDYNLSAPGRPQHIDGLEVTPRLIADTGVHPAAGRFFSASDGPNVVLISYRLFAQIGPGIVGKPITLNNQSYTVVGALPAWFRLPLVTVESQNSNNDVWLPMRKPADEAHLRGYSIYGAYARLKPGVTVAQARADSKRVAAQLQKQYHPNNRNYTAALFSLQETVVKEIRPILLLLFGAAGLLLFITCANVAGLLVSRSVGRARETAVRIAIGGGQKQLALQYFSESLVISIAAAAGGVLASVALVRLMVSYAGDYIPRSDEITTNWWVTLFALALAFLTATLSALAPLWQALRTQPNEILSDGLRASAGIRSRKLSQALVVSEIALAFTLLSVGALLVWQLQQRKSASPGFDPDHVTSFQLTKSDAQGRNAAQMAAYVDKVLNGLRAVPGVSQAALTNQLPLAGCCYTSALFLPGQTSRNATPHEVSLLNVSPEYFGTLRIPLLRGRLLNEHDTNERLIAVVIDEAAARQYWPGRNAVGQLARLGAPDGDQVQVAGVVGTVRNRGMGEAPLPELYVSNKLVPVNPMKFVVRSNLAESSLAPAIRRAVANVDPLQPVYSVQSMRKIFTDSLIFERIESMVVTFFALAALLMACLGIYGLTSYSVRQRTMELGTRMALGATGRDLLRLTLHYPATFLFGGCDWALDGQAILCATAAKDGECALARVSLSGEIRSAGSLKRHWMGRVSRIGRSEQFAFSAGDAHTESQIFVLDASNGRTVRLTNGVDWCPTVSANRDGSRLLTVSKNRVSSIWTADPDGQSTRITSPVGRYFGVSWTPDHRLLTQTFLGNESRILELATVGRQVRSVVQSNALNVDAEMSPDGRLMTFISSKSANRHVWRCDADGLNQQQITWGEGEDENPRWSPDGRYIYYANKTGEHTRIDRIDVHTGNPELVSKRLDCRRPDISADGSRIACECQDGSGQWQLGWLEATTGSFHSANRQASESIPFRWVPGQNAISFVSTVHGVSNLLAMDLKSRHERRLTGFSDENIFEFDWDRSGENVALVRGRSVFDAVLLSRSSN